MIYCNRFIKGFIDKISICAAIQKRPLPSGIFDSKNPSAIICSWN